MKKRVFAAILVMVLWAAGAYTLGHYHGKSGGGFSLPSVSVDWSSEKGDAEVKEQAEAVDYVHESNMACGIESAPVAAKDAK